MALRRWLSLLLVSVLFAVSPLAYSEAPDEVWLGGYYDGGEADDALIDLQLHHSAIAMLAVYVSPSITLVPARRHCRRGFRRSAPSWQRAPGHLLSPRTLPKS